MVNFRSLHLRSLLRSCRHHGFRPEGDKKSLIAKSEVLFNCTTCLMYHGKVFSPPIRKYVTNDLTIVQSSPPKKFFHFHVEYEVVAAGPTRRYSCPFTAESRSSVVLLITCLLTLLGSRISIPMSKHTLGPPPLTALAT